MHVYIYIRTHKLIIFSEIYQCSQTAERDDWSHPWMGV